MKLQIKATSIKQNNSIKIANKSRILFFCLFLWKYAIVRFISFGFWKAVSYLLFRMNVWEWKKNFEEKSTCSMEEGKKNIIIIMIAKSFSFVLPKENIDEMQTFATNDGVWIFLPSEVTDTDTYITL